MKDYILSVITVAALGCIANGVCPEGEGQGLKKAVSFIMSLLLIVTVGKQIISFVSAFDGDELSDIILSSESLGYNEVWSSTVKNITATDAEKAVAELTSERFGLEEDCFSVKCEISEKENAYVIDRVTVELFGAGMFTNPRKIELFLSEYLGCECDVREGG